MFEKYTGKARRVIFWARSDAGEVGSPSIETEHILLGLLREDKALSHRLLHGETDVEDIRSEIDSHTLKREKIPTSNDMPVSDECKHVFGYAAEEAEGMSHTYIGTEHLLLGLLREEKSFAAELLRERGLRLDGVRETLRRGDLNQPGP